MTYAEFKEALITNLWKNGDQVVIDQLDNLIRVAETELNRILKIEDRMKAAALIASNGTATLPIDCREVRHVTYRGKGPMKYITPADFSDRFSPDRGTSHGEQLVYSSINRSIKLGGKYIGNLIPPILETIDIWYYMKLVPFAETPNGPCWLADEEYDIFFYTVLKHCAPFMREDERTAVWGSFASAALEAALDEDTDRKYLGTPIQMKFSKGIR